VECYDPTLDTWTPVADMSVCRQGVGVGVLVGLIYAIGGYDGGKYLKSVEVYRPSDGLWSSVADMEICRYRPGNYNSYIFYDNLCNNRLNLHYIFI